MPRVLVTGANGFLATHIVKAAIDAGHTIVGSVRSQSKAKEVLATHPEWEGKIDFVYIDDYSRLGVWDDVFKTHDIDYVVHSAAPVFTNADNSDYNTHYLTPSVEGNKQLLQSAKSYGKNVKGISVTSSTNSLVVGTPEEFNSTVLSSDIWIPLTNEEAIASGNPILFYCAAKKAAEKTVWEFVETEKPNFQVTTFLPPLILGPANHYVKDINAVNFSNDIIYAIWNGSSETVPATPFPAFVDVRDLAKVHVQALSMPAAANKRLLLGQTFDFQEVANVLRTVPELKNRVAEAGKGEPGLVYPRLDTTPFQKAFPEFKYTPREKTFVDQAKRMLELEGTLGK